MKDFVNKHTYCTCSLTKRAFNCNRWLAVDEADGKVCALLCHNFICINTCEAKSLEFGTIHHLSSVGKEGGGVTSFSGETEGGSVVAIIEFKRGDHRKLATN